MNDERSLSQELAPNGLVWKSKGIGWGMLDLWPGRVTSEDRTHQPWTDSEIEMILDPERATDEILSAKMGRTKKAIRLARDKYRLRTEAEKKKAKARKENGKAVPAHPR